MISRVPELLVNIAHIQKINVWQTWPAISVLGPIASIARCPRRAAIIASLGY
jgi:hypothetical protein